MNLPIQLSHYQLSDLAKFMHPSERLSAVALLNLDDRPGGSFAVKLCSERSKRLYRWLIWTTNYNGIETTLWTWHQLLVKDYPKERK